MTGGSFDTGGVGLVSLSVLKFRFISLDGKTGLLSLSVFKFRFISLDGKTGLLSLSVFKFRFMSLDGMTGLLSARCTFLFGSLLSVEEDEICQ